MCSGNEACYLVLFVWNREVTIVDTRMSVIITGAIHHTGLALRLPGTSGNTFTGPSWMLAMSTCLALTNET